MYNNESGSGQWAQVKIFTEINSQNGVLLHEAKYTKPDVQSKLQIAVKVIK